MLVIRHAQVAAFDEELRRASIDRAVRVLRARFPDACAAKCDDDLRALVRHGIARARSYGVVAERDVLKYLGLMAAFGRDFDELEWAAPTLRDAGVDPTVRMQVLFDEARWRAEQE
jgi:hypothetical protein